MTTRYDTGPLLNADELREALAAALASGDRDTIAKMAAHLRAQCDAEGVIARYFRVGDLLDAILASPLLAPVPPSEDLPLRCPDCGSIECEMTAWVTVNGEHVSLDDGPSDEVWCPKCEVHFHYADLTTELCSGPGIDNDEGDVQGEPR